MYTQVAIRVEYLAQSEVVSQFIECTGHQATGLISRPTEEAEPLPMDVLNYITLQ